LVCHANEGAEPLSAQFMHLRCRDHAIERAVQSLRNPQLAAIYATHSG
jgi:hypothetical protein